MTKDLLLVDARRALRSRGDLSDEGWRENRIRQALAAGALQRVHRNRYVDGELWRSLWPEAQHRLEVLAAAEEMHGGHVAFSYASAAVLHGLPLYRHRPSRVEITLGGGRRASSTAAVLRHDEPVDDADLVEIGGVVCTSLERTVFDLSRTLSWEASVAVADAALRRAAVQDRRLDLDADAAWRERMRERTGHASAARGIRQALHTVSFADGRAELPAESVGRVQLVRLGFGDLDLQVRVPAPSGGAYEIDIALRAIRAFVEVDGEAKYRDEALRAGRSIEDVVLAEKRREDWVRGITQWRMCRVGPSHVLTPAALGARLASFGISPP